MTADLRRKNRLIHDNDITNIQRTGENFKDRRIILDHHIHVI